MVAILRAQMGQVADRPIMAFATVDDWARWLDVNHATTTGIRIKLARKDTGLRSITHDEAVEIALCYGWIDGQAGSFDDRHWVQTFTPRRARSKWSKINCGRAEALIRAGRMKAAGMREIERAKADGRWGAAYDAPSVARVPKDLAAELKKDRKAAEFFAKLDSRNRYAILYRLQDAKKPQTRTRRLENFVSMLKQGKKIYP